jgi:hypothetical protein
MPSYLSASTAEAGPHTAPQPRFHEPTHRRAISLPQSDSATQRLSDSARRGKGRDREKRGERPREKGKRRTSRVTTDFTHDDAGCACMSGITLLQLITNPIHKSEKLKSENKDRARRKTASQHRPAASIYTFCNINLAGTPDRLLTPSSFSSVAASKSCGDKTLIFFQRCGLKILRR